MKPFFLQVGMQIIAFLAFPLVTICQTNINDKLPERPNILWLVTEDMGPYIAAFGDSTIQTPNLSRLASEGVIYPNLYSTSGVCAPSRAAIATGMYPSSIGANHMRTNSNMDQTGLKAYEAVPPSEVKMISEWLRMNGYYCTNNYKTDYQFKAPVTAWDESSPYAHWRNREENQPFFSIFNFTETHESGLFEPYGFRHIETRHYRAGDRNYKWDKDRMTEKETPVHLDKNTKFPIPPYLPNTEVVRNDMWKLYNNISEMDKQVGAVLKQLEEDGLLENTIIIFYGDHGGPLPRQKRLIYDSGLNTPMIIRFPNKKQAGNKDEQLVSFIDFAPTLLSLVGIPAPNYMQGQAFLGKHQAKKERTYIHAAADRFDGITDVIRAVRDEQFKYIRNYRPEQGYYLPVKYRERIPTMQELLRLRKEGKLNAVQAQWFRENKPKEELYDCKADPHELNNLANNPAYRKELERLRAEMNRWIEDIGDQPNLPEEKLINQLWNGNKSKPVTAEPIVIASDGIISISCSTEGASIGYKIVDKNGKTPKEWSVYQNKFTTSTGVSIKVQAHRIGFKPSKIVEVELVSNTGNTPPKINPPAGRIAIIADGNSPDPDDLGGTAVSLALLRATGLENRLVHYSHSCDLYKNQRNISEREERERHALMQSSCDVTARRWGGFDDLTFYDAKWQQDETLQDLAKAINASTADDPLWIVEAGEPDIIGLALSITNKEKHKFVKVITHHPANDNAGDFYTWQQILDFGVEEVRIPDQNIKLKVKLAEWDWAKNHTDARIQQVWLQGKIAELDNVVKFQKGKWDCSDAGMVLYWITGATNDGLKQGSVEDVKGLLLDYIERNPEK